MSPYLLNIGIMLTRNEEDVIEEVMTEHSRYFEHIFVLDGSNDSTPDILRKFKNVIYLVKDEDVYPGRPIRDGVRQFLISEAQKRFGYKGYFSLLHGDEIFHDDPNDVVRKAQEEGIEVVRWRSMTFFPHVSEKDKPADTSLGIQKRMGWCSPNWFEPRQFKNKKGICYDLERQGKAIPCGLNELKVNENIPVFKHYSFRTPEQMRKRIKDRSARGFVTFNDYLLEEKELFLETLKEGERAICFSSEIASYELGDKPLGNAYKKVFSKAKGIADRLSRHPKRNDFLQKVCSTLIEDEVACRELMKDILREMEDKIQ